MLRIPAVLGLLVGASCAASAQELTLTQGAAHNYALIAPDAVSTDITVKQTGQTNTMASFQSGRSTRSTSTSAPRAPTPPTSTSSAA
jgi:hypothetical protein